VDDCKQQEWAKHAHFSQHFLAPGSLVVFCHYNHMILICKILLLIHSYTLHLCLRESVLSPFEITICALGVSVNYCHCCHYKLLGLLYATLNCHICEPCIHIILWFMSCFMIVYYILYHLSLNSLLRHHTSTYSLFFFSQMQCHFVCFFTGQVLACYFLKIPE